MKRLHSEASDSGPSTSKEANGGKRERKEVAPSADFIDETELIKSVHAAVIQSANDISQESNTGVSFDSEVLSRVASLVYDTVTEDWAADLLAFASHGNRVSVNVDDVALLMRRNPDLSQIVHEAAGCSGNEKSGKRGKLTAPKPRRKTSGKGWIIENTPSMGPSATSTPFKASAVPKATTPLPYTPIPKETTSRLIMSAVTPAAKSCYPIAEENENGEADVLGTITLDDAPIDVNCGRLSPPMRDADKEPNLPNEEILVVESRKCSMASSPVRPSSPSLPAPSVESPIQMKKTITPRRSNQEKPRSPTPDVDSFNDVEDDFMFLGQPSAKHEDIPSSSEPPRFTVPDEDTVAAASSVRHSESPDLFADTPPHTNDAPLNDSFDSFGEDVIAVQCEDPLTKKSNQPAAAEVVQQPLVVSPTSKPSAPSSEWKKEFSAFSFGPAASSSTFTSAPAPISSAKEKDNTSIPKVKSTPIPNRSKPKSLTGQPTVKKESPSAAASPAPNSFLHDSFDEDFSFGSNRKKKTVVANTPKRMNNKSKRSPGQSTSRPMSRIGEFLELDSFREDMDSFNDLD